MREVKIYRRWKKSFFFSFFPLFCPFYFIVHYLTLRRARFFLRQHRERASRCFRKINLYAFHSRESRNPLMPRSKTRRHSISFPFPLIRRTAIRTSSENKRTARSAPKANVVTHSTTLRNKLKRQNVLISH